MCRKCAQCAGFSWPIALAAVTPDGCAFCGKQTMRFGLVRLGDFVRVAPIYSEPSGSPNERGF